MRKVLVGVDGTPSARDAIALARALAVDEGCDMILVGAYTASALRFPPALRSDVDLTREVERMLLDERARHAPQARTHVRADVSPGRALCHEVERERPDLLVLGSSHRVREGRAGSGRTGRQVLHGAGCAVAVAARGLHERPVALRQVVVGFDGSDEAHVALAVAEEVARRAGARLTAVAVVDDRLPATAAPAGLAVELVHWDDLVEAQRASTERLVASLAREHPGIETEVRVGDPAVELAAAAEGADLLVLGSRRWGALARLVIGSTGEELSRDAPCSLLLVPRPDEEGERTASAHA